MYSEESSIKDIQHDNVKSEVIRRQTFHNWSVQFIDKNHLAAAGFYYTDWKDIVCCAFCDVQLGQWKEEDNPSKEHERWSALVGLLKSSLLATYLLAPPMNNLSIAATCAGLRAVSTIACIYSFVMCTFFIALITNFQCALYSWTAKSIETQDK